MTTFGIRGIGCAFPAATRTVRELAAAGALESTPELLESFGFARVHVAESESPYELAIAAARQTLDANQTSPDDVGLLIWAGAPAATAYDAAAQANGGRAWHDTGRFRYPAARLQYELGMGGASVIGLDQLACTSLFGAVRVATALCEREGISRALCVASEFAPRHASREQIFNCTSDASCAVLIERSAARNRLVASSHVSKGYYWDHAAVRDEVVASYFPTAVHVIAEVLARAGWSAGDVDWVIPHNVSLRSWEILLGLAGLRGARLWRDGIARDGHTLAGDNFINLRDALASGSVGEGDRLLLFSYGYGAHWTALAVEA